MPKNNLNINIYAIKDANPVKNLGVFIIFGFFYSNLVKEKTSEPERALCTV